MLQNAAFPAAIAGFLMLAMPAAAQLVTAVAAAPEPPRRVFPFRESTGTLDNPERGFSWAVDLLGTRSFARVRDEHGVTLIRANGRLDAYRSQDLSSEILASIDTRLDDARAAGVKLILRFAYNEGPHPNTEPDASLAWIKRHIEQLKPNLQKHADVIAWMEAGFIGAWGEWHNSTNGLDRDVGAKRDVVHALLGALPVTRGIQLRSPADLLAIHGPSFTGSDAHNGSTKSRTGHHNDCFLASETDSGTYGRGQRTIEQDKALVAAYGRFTPIGGETCKINPPRSDCPSALAELEQLGFSELNLAYNRTVLDGWRTGGCFEVIHQRLGYRLTVETIALPDTLVRATAARITIRIRNTGFSAPVNARPVFLVLDGPVRELVRLPADPRKWGPGRTHTIEVKATISKELPQGRYALGLWLPDAAPSLQADPSYAIQLANDGAWSATTGINRMLDGVDVR